MNNNNRQPTLINAPASEPVKKPRGKTAPEQSTAQQLSGIIKSTRDIMRKDRGLSGDGDRLPMLTWLLFLKFLDDLECERETESQISGKFYRPALEPPYRWRDWAAGETRLTGDDLRSFVNEEHCTRPDNTKGAGLFYYLRGLTSTNPGDRRDVIAGVFKDTYNRMVSGYLLREVVDKVNGISFTTSSEIQALGQLYESLLKEMRDSAGDAGEFYTPRAVVKFMVAAVNPRIGETVLDPACGTGGFLVEAFMHLKKLVEEVADDHWLQAEAIRGGEAKPLPYLLVQMNLLLHGLASPKITSGNSLAVKIAEIGDDQRADIILANPPFGGEEESGIEKNFPDDKRTRETALLFLQLIMRKLRRAPKPGRAGVVVPNGVLFGDGVCARIKDQLLTEFNLHTIVRLPNGVFAPYTSIPTNLLFFDRSGATEDIWYYEQPLPEGKKSYSKTAPMQAEEFDDCLAWWHDREENDRAWRVPADTIRANGFNLDVKNPRAAVGLDHLPPEQLVKSLLEKERRIMVLMEEIQQALTGSGL